MAKKKNTPLKDEQVYSFEDLYQKLDEIQNTINNKNVQEAHELLSSPVNSNRECTVDSDMLTKSVAGAMDSYMQSNHVKIVKDDEVSDTEQTKSLLEDYRNELVEIKAQPATPAVTIIDKNIVEAAVTTVIEKGHTNATFITKPERPTYISPILTRSSDVQELNAATSSLIMIWFLSVPNAAAATLTAKIEFIFWIIPAT